ncbi:SpoIIIAH-like family protein [Brevibacillus humidisoli]|uniref:SpoIIIAH-like family protein n=1 Tax=Brevibacillus humidisoli TaxID=2895522 RepID=UPI001E4751F7|nr:SpoIIIAH-like family protein [Brevibacillus humidisoli]UFJ42917.1 SpoIIIAH-like family protein [Brevibacillus humidisoli]
MVVRKQTVWLLTMLAVMVVLSGYYLVKGPSEQTPALGEPTGQQDSLSGVQVETEQTDQPAPDAAPVEGTPDGSFTDEAAAGGESTTVEDSSILAQAGNETFQSIKLNREALIEKQKDEQMEIIVNPDSSPQAMVEARARHDELSALQNNIMALEEILKADGYKDAVVLAQNESVKVIVQADKLDRKQVVDIIAMAKQHLNVPGYQVTVSSRP